MKLNRFVVFLNSFWELFRIIILLWIASFILNPYGKTTSLIFILLLGGSQIMFPLGIFFLGYNSTKYNTLKPLLLAGKLISLFTEFLIILFQTLPGILIIQSIAKIINFNVQGLLNESFGTLNFYMLLLIILIIIVDLIFFIFVLLYKSGDSEYTDNNAQKVLPELKIVQIEEE